MQDIYNTLDNAIIENPSISIKEGNIIKEGFNSEIDELRRAKAHGKEWIATLENDEKRKKQTFTHRLVALNGMSGVYSPIKSFISD